MKNKCSGLTISYVKKSNQRMILEYVFNSTSTSRTELSKKLSLSKPAISDNLEGLLELGVVLETGAGEASRKGGRKPNLLQFNFNYRYVIAIDLNYSNPVFVLANLKGDILREFTIRVSANASQEDCVELIENSINILINASGVYMKDVFCIAIASPGVFDSDGVLRGQNQSYGGVSWSSMGLKTILEERFKTYVMMRNDIMAATIGEWSSGTGCGLDNLIYVSCGIGLGSGIILNGQLYEGSRFSAGQLYSYTDTEKLPRGVNIENTVCINRLISNIKDKTGRELTFDEIKALYTEKDASVCDEVERICRELCPMILNLACFLAVDTVIFGGEYAVFGDRLVQIYGEAIREMPDAPEVRVTQNEYSGICGMIYAAREKCFDVLCTTHE